MPPARSSSRPFKKADVDAVVDLLEQLPRLHATNEAGPSGYSFADRAADFMAVFSGNSTPEQGRRVLAQIAQICDPITKISDADLPGTLAFKAGQRRVMHEIMLCMVAREPVRVERKEPTNEHASSTGA